MTFSFRPEGEQVAALDKMNARIMLRDVKDDDEDAPTLFSGLLITCEAMHRRYGEGSTFLGMAFIGPKGDWITAYFMAGWLHPDHPALDEVRHTNFGDEGREFPWDDSRQALIDAGVVGSRFYRECMAHHQERNNAVGEEKSAFHPRWGSVWPPLAHHVALLKHPHAEE